MYDLLATAELAKTAGYSLSNISISVRNAALESMAQALLDNSAAIVKSNSKDVIRAQAKRIPAAMIDRLMLNEERIQAMADGLVSLSSLPDPIGGADNVIKRPNGLEIVKKRVPIGVIGIIYESRPNVTSDACGICLKSGNVAFLRGGSESIESNKTIVEILHSAGITTGLPAGFVQLVEDTSRETVLEMMKLNSYIDVLIPRGSASLINSVVENSTVPVIQTGAGNCHIYVDFYADLNKAFDIVVNSKCSRPSVCNSAETLLLHETVAAEFLYAVTKSLRANGVELIVDEVANAIIPNATPATEEDWYKEYNDYKLAIKVVDDIESAISHINKYSTKHSEVIISENYSNVKKFMDEIDSACVYANASTRFTDGEEFGFGAEIGISTQKLHARGPMGLHELTTYKYCIYGDGQIRK